MSAPPLATHARAAAGLPDVALLERTALFAALTTERQRELLALATLIEAQPGECLVAEGASAQSLFVVASGEVEITRRVTAADPRHALRPLGPGETFGELGLVASSPASASVYARVPTTVLAIPLAALHAIFERDPASAPVYRALAGELAARLRTLTEVTVRALEREAAELHARVVVGTTLVWLVVILTVFTSALGLTRQLAESRWLTPVTTVLCLLGLAALAPVVRQARLPAAFWGLTTHGWRAAVRDAIVFSLPPIAVLLGVKWALITWADGWVDTPLLHVTPLLASGAEAALRNHGAALAAYLLVSIPLQEIAVRGGLQSALEEFLAGPHRTVSAIVVSNLVFSVSHTFISSEFALLAFFPGLLWGWLYHRQRTVIGPILSHALIGLVAFEVIGVLAQST